MMNVAETILMQLGGNKFIAMTGSHHLMSDGNTLRMQLVKNMSKANRLHITLDEATDLYTMRFFKYTAGRLNRKTYEWSDDKTVEVKEYTGVFADQMQDIFTEVTGMYTHL